MRHQGMTFQTLQQQYLEAKGKTLETASEAMISDATAYASCYDWYITKQLVSDSTADLASKVWVNKYALHDKNGICRERTLEDTWKRIAKTLAEVEVANSGDSANEFSKWNDIFLDALQDFKYAPGGSGLYSIGNPYTCSSVSNCFVMNPPQDNLESIFDVAKSMARVYANRGGCGVDISNLRPCNAPTNNAAKSSTGAASFMDFYSYVTGKIGQEGRRGALLMSMRIDHPDIFKFIKMKRDEDKQWFITELEEAGIDLKDYKYSAIADRLKSCSQSNVSVKITDKFISALEKDEMFELWFEYDNGYPRYSEFVRAKDIWDALIEGAWASAEPGMFNWDHILRESTSGKYDGVIYKGKKVQGKEITSNPCQPGFATVLTPNGIRTFDDITVGSTIWSGNQWTRVVNKVATGIKKVFRYTTNAGEFIGTENHRVVSNGTKVEVGKTDSIDICIGNPSFLRLDIEGCRMAENSQTIMDGWVIGDGSVHTASNNLVFICVGENDYDIHTALPEYLIKARPDIKETAWEVNTTITADELSLTYSRRVPSRFKFGSFDTVADFLCGLYSANGSITENRVTLKSASVGLIKDVQEMLSSLGISSYVTINKEKEVEFSEGSYTYKEPYVLNIGDIVNKTKFCKLIGFKQDYKLDNLINVIKDESHGGKTTYDITTITEVGDLEVFDITVDADEHTYWTGGLLVSNCGEIVMPPDSCNLGQMYLPAFVEYPYTPEAYFNREKYEKYAAIAVRMQDNIKQLDIDSGLLLPEHQLSAEAFRRLGLGNTGYGDMFAMLGIKYGSDESIACAENIAEIYKEVVYNASVDLAIDKGSFPVFDWDRHKQSPFIQRLKPETQQRIASFGIRNIALLTQAPNGTGSILCRNTTSGLEPMFFAESNRNVKNPDGSITRYTVYHQGIEDCKRAGGDPSVYVAAHDVSYEKKIELQAAMQKHIDHSISVTANLPAEISKEEIGSLYLKAFKLGCKGFTVYREGSRGSVLSALDEKKVVKRLLDKPLERPKTTEVDIHKVKYKDKPWSVLVGSLDGIPIEVFAGIEEDTPLPNKYHKAELTKKSKGHYSLTVYLSADSQEDVIKINNIGARFPSPEGLVLTRFISLLLRNRVPISDIVEQLQKSASSMFDYPAVLARVLKQYASDEELAAKIKGTPCPDCGKELKIKRESGCSVVYCENCNYVDSKCG
jgi:ribonucleoside-diphosphate reductase alpha chain